MMNPSALPQTIHMVLAAYAARDLPWPAYMRHASARFAEPISQGSLAIALTPVGSQLLQPFSGDYSPSGSKDSTCKARGDGRPV